MYPRKNRFYYPKDIHDAETKVLKKHSRYRVTEIPSMIYLKYHGTPPIDLFQWQYIIGKIQFIIKII